MTEEDGKCWRKLCAAFDKAWNRLAFRSHPESNSREVAALAAARRELVEFRDRLNRTQPPRIACE